MANKQSKKKPQKVKKNGDIVKWMLLAVLLVSLVAGAGLLYGKLSKEYKPNNLMTNEGVGGQESKEPEHDHTEEEDEHDHTEDYTAPDFTVVDGDGNMVKLSDFKGKAVVLNFWATWCGYCVMEMPDFDAASEKYPDVQFMMVNATDGVQETIEKAKAFVEQEGFGFDVFYDTAMQAVNAYGISSFPTTYFIDAAGNLVAWGNGMLDMESLETGIGMILDK